MRSFAAIALLGGLLAGCSPKSAESEPLAEVPAPIPAAIPAEAAPEPEPPTPAPKRLAAAGTYFLLVKKSVGTADGIIGFKPGTQVMQQGDGSFAVEGHKLRLLPGEITNDLDIAAGIADADAQRQAALRQTPAPVATPAPAPSQPVAGPTLRPGGAAGPGEAITRDGWVWEKDRSGMWRRAKPVR
ncbi:MAG: hypothetical protein ABMA13_05705 [Chthoniobacteraceae bacterium]